MAIKISNNPDSNWKNNSIQFPRLIAELEALGVFDNPELIQQLSDEMDLSNDQVVNLIDRAQKEWDKIKKIT